MKRIALGETPPDWRVVTTTKRSQAAIMVIEPGDKEGGPTNRHDSDQWLFIVDGRGSATVEGDEVALEPGVLLLIEKGETHEVRADAGVQLRTLNVYAPPAY
jgi:mannose-6-phosphate isomerase-like protein (cupin superfamily)